MLLVLHVFIIFVLILKNHWNSSGNDFSHILSLILFLYFHYSFCTFSLPHPFPIFLSDSFICPTIPFPLSSFPLSHTYFCLLLFLILSFHMFILSSFLFPLLPFLYPFHTFQKDTVTEQK